MTISIPMRRACVAGVPEHDTAERGICDPSCRPVAGDEKKSIPRQPSFPDLPVRSNPHILSSELPSNLTAGTGITLATVDSGSIAPAPSLDDVASVGQSSKSATFTAAPDPTSPTNAVMSASQPISHTTSDLRATSVSCDSVSESESDANLDTTSALASSTPSTPVAAISETPIPHLLLMPPPASVPTAAGSGVATNPTRPKILLVEDEPVNQKVVTHMLRMHYEVDIVSDGRAAVDKVQEMDAGYAAILMDINMPVMSGWTATEKLRAAGIKIPILALTGNAMVEDRAKCLDVGMNAVLVKPFSRSELLSALKLVL